MSQISSDPSTGEEFTASEAWALLLDLVDHDGTDVGSDRVADLLRVVQRSADVQQVDTALPLLQDAAPARRQLAAKVLGQFGYPVGRPFGSRIAPALAAAARQETDDPTREILVDALGSAEDRAWVPEMIRHAADPYAPVRVAVAGSLPLMFAGDDPDDDAVATLIALSTDTDPEVRDWATTALGSLSDRDTPEIRDALAARLDDPGGDTAFEAGLGLARRGDGRVRDFLVQRLSDEDQGVYLLDLEAAAALADPVLLPHLLRLQDEWTDQDADDKHLQVLQSAIARSAPSAVLQAAERESQLVSEVAALSSGTGWRIELIGSYPRTVVRFVGPDGERVSPIFGSLWEDLSPEKFDSGAEARQWSSELSEHTQSEPTGEASTSCLTAAP